MCGVDTHRHRLVRVHLCARHCSGHKLEMLGEQMDFVSSPAKCTESSFVTGISRIVNPRLPLLSFLSTPREQGRCHLASLWCGPGLALRVLTWVWGAHSFLEWDCAGNCKSSSIPGALAYSVLVASPRPRNCDNRNMPSTCSQPPCVGWGLETGGSAHTLSGV